MLPVVAAVLVSLVACNPAFAQSIPDSMMAKQDRMLTLEREISGLEARLAKAQQDWISISQRLSELEKCIMTVYMEIDAAETELANARRSLNSRIRALYMSGRTDGLMALFGARDVSDFMVRYQYLVDVTRSEADVFNQLRDKRQNLKEKQDQLVEYKQEAARLARSADASQIQSQIDQKRRELADITSELIATELPVTRSPAPITFSPTKVYTQPEENGFARTGQLFSGYSSWYGNEFQGRPTASGEMFEQYAFTCAHRTLPFGTWLRITFKGRSVIVKVNDRGPFVGNRVLDLSRGAAEAIGLSGVEWVDAEIVVPRAR